MAPKDPCVYCQETTGVRNASKLCVVAYEDKTYFILICEICCDNRHTDAFLIIPGYQLAVRKDGSYQGRAWGLLICAKEELRSVKLNLESFDKFDKVTGIYAPWLGGRLSLVLAYRPPRYPGSVEDRDNTRQLAQLIRRLPGPALLCKILICRILIGGNSVLQQVFDNKFLRLFRIGSGH